MLPGPVTRSTGRHSLGAVREHRDGLRAAGRVHLVDAEQRAGGQDGGVRQPAELRLRRARRRRGPDARLLGGDDVHHDGGRVDRAAAGDVEPDALDRHPALGDGAAGHDLGGVRRCAAARGGRGGRGGSTPPGRPARRVELRPARCGDRLGGDPDPSRAGRRRTSRPTRSPPPCRDGARPRRWAAPSPGRLRRRTRHGAAGRQGAALGEGGAAQVDSGDHTAILVRARSHAASGRPYHWLIRCRPRLSLLTISVHARHTEGRTTVRST